MPQCTLIVLYYINILQRIHICVVIDNIILYGDTAAK